MTHDITLRILDWRDEDTVLWPLFRYMHDKQNKYEEWRAPFPIFFYGKDDGSPGAVAHSSQSNAKLRPPP